MQFSRSAPLQGRPLLDLNLLPRRYRPRAIPMLGIGLGLLAAAGILLLLAIVQFKGAVEADVAILRGDLRQAQQRVTELGPPAGDNQNDPLVQSQVGWASVLQAIIAAAPADVRIQDVSFTTDPARGPQAIVKGDADEYAAVVEYADNLHSSSFFSRIGIQSIGQVTPTATTTATAPMPVTTPTSRGGFVTQPTPTFVPPTPQLIQPTATPAPGPPRPPTPTPTPPPPPLAITPTITSPLTGTRTVTPAASGTPTPASSNDFAVSEKTQNCDMSLPPTYVGNLISGYVYDFDGSPMPGIGVRVTSIHTSNPWSADTATDGQGHYSFALTKANFQVQVTGYRSDVASELWTLSDQQQGACFWTVNFKKTSNRTPTVQPSGTPTTTPTRTTTGTTTPTPTLTPTPITNLTVPFSADSLSASNNAADAWRAVDNNDGTAWNSGGMPNQFWQGMFGPRNPGGTYSTLSLVAAVSLKVNQSPAGNTKHLVHFLDYQGADIPGTMLTIEGYTNDGDTLSRVLASPINGVAGIKVETATGPSYVAWYEIRAYPSIAPTPTPSPTLSPTPSGPTATPTVTGTPTPTGQGSNAWQYFETLGFYDPPLSEAFYNPLDNDWYMFPSDSVTRTYTIRGLNGPGVNLGIQLYQGSGNGYPIEVAANVCGDGPLISRELSPNSQFYVKAYSPSWTTGTYSLAVRYNDLSCTDPVSPAPTPVAPVSAPTITSTATDTPTPVPPTMTATPTPTATNTPSGGAAVEVSYPAGARGSGLAAPSGSLPGDGLRVPLREPVGFTIVLDIKMGGTR